MKKKTARTLTLIVVGFALYTQIVWAIVASNYHSGENAITNFLTYFPPFLRSNSFIVYATLGLAIAGIVFSAKWNAKCSGNTYSGGWEKAAAIFSLIICILILLLTLFQLM